MIDPSALAAAAAQAEEAGFRAEMTTDGIMIRGYSRATANIPQRLIAYADVSSEAVGSAISEIRAELSAAPSRRTEWLK